MNSDTPRTDAEFSRIVNSGCLPECNSYGHAEKCPYCNPELVLRDFTESLERENKQLRDGLKVCKEALESCEVLDGVRVFDIRIIDNALSHTYIQSLKDSHA